MEQRTTRSEADERTEVEITATADFRPASTLLHAASTLRGICEGRTAGSAWAGLGGLVVLAFAVEGFCNTYGEEAFPDRWNGVDGLEWKPVLWKLRRLARHAAVTVNFGLQPWSDVKALIAARNELAHPRPVTTHRTVTRRLTQEEQSGVYGTQIALMHWEEMAKPQRLATLEANVRAAMVLILEGLGHNRWELEIFGSGSYVMSVPRET